MLLACLLPDARAAAAPARVKLPAPALEIRYDPTIIVVALPPGSDARMMRTKLLRPEAAQARQTLDQRRVGPLCATATATLLRIGLQPGADPILSAASAAVLPDVLWAAPNRIYLGDPREFTPNDPRYNEQYALPLIQADQAWDLIPAGTPPVTIAIVDDGMQMNHADLAAGLWVNPAEIAGNGVDDDGNGLIDDVSGWDFIGNDNLPNPIFGDDHGTHVAGIAAARTNNTTGIAGIAGGPGGGRILPVRFFATGQPWPSTLVANALNYVAGSGARILNISYNVDGFVDDPIVIAALEHLYARGVLIFNSAGNNNQANPPRQVFEQMLFVANTNQFDQRNTSSNYGVGIDLAAPGTNILSTVPSDQYALSSGTSMAAPAAAGVAALLWSYRPGWTREQVAAQILGTADPIDTQNPGFAGLLGSGRVNAYRALSTTLPPPRLGALEGLPAAGGTLRDEITTFTLRLRHTLDSSTVTPANFELRRAGDDQIFGTSDDRIIPLTINNGRPHRIGTNWLDFRFAGALPPGDYRFTAFSGGLRDPFGQPLDGNGDGTGGDDFIHAFRVSYPLSGRVFEDWNGNGLRDADEPMLADQTVFLDLNNNGSISQITRTYNATGLPRSIPDNNQTGISVPITISDIPWQIAAVTTSLTASHTYAGDLVIALSSPFGTTVQLANNRGEAGAYSGTIFDDTASISIAQGSPPFSGPHRPETPLASFNEQIFNGTWNLRIADTGALDPRPLAAWTLTFALREPLNLSVADGHFWFNRLEATTYQLRLALASGWNATTPLQRTVVISDTAESVETAAYGLIRTNAIYGRVYEDHNRNGIRDAGESGIAGVMLYLDLNTNGILDSNEPWVMSDGEGRYRFSNQSAGSKLVRQIPVSGYILQNRGGLPVTLNAGATITGQDFANIAVPYRRFMPLIRLEPPA